MAREEKKRDRDIGGRVQRPKGQGNYLADYRLSVEDIRRAEINYGEAVKLATDECSRIVAKHFDLSERYGIPFVHVGDMLKAALLDGATGEKLTRLLDGCTIQPLQIVWDRLAEIVQELETYRETEANAVYQQYVVSETSHFERLIGAFKRKLKEWRDLKQEFASAESLLRESLATTRQMAERGATQRPLLQQQAELLSGIISHVQTALEEGKLSHVATIVEWEQRLQTELKSFRALLDDFNKTQQRYEQFATNFGHGHDMLSKLLQQNRRLREGVEAWHECFAEAGVDPYSASGENREQLQSEQKEAVLVRCQELTTTPPPPFPEFKRGKDLIQRAENLVDHLVDEFDKLEKQAQRRQPPLSPSLSPSLRLTTPPAPQLSAGMSVTPLQLAVCTFAAFCKQLPSGQPHPSSGRTASKVWGTLLEAQGFTFGFSLEAFVRALNEAEAQGLMVHFDRRRGKEKPKTCWRPSLSGFERAVDWYRSLPENFKEKVAAANEKLREQQAAWQEKRFKGKQSS